MSIEHLPRVTNAACSEAKTHEDVAALIKTKIDGIVIGSITVEPRQGNAEPRWHDETSYALNSFGMPNQGAAYYETALPEMVHAAHTAKKQLFLSVAGFNEQEYATLASLAERAGVDGVELNLGCPNISVDGKQKPIASFDPAYMQRIIAAVREETALPLTIKLSPYSNPAELAATAHILASHDITGVVTSNTFPNSLALQSEGSSSVLANVYGGMSGAALRAIALGQVKQFRDLLPEHIGVIGVGGIESAHDADQFFRAGATGIQAATLIVREGHAAIDRIVA